MELRQLRYFVAVAEELHFGRAAARLNMAQPPLSQQIKKLEADIGVLLFERNRTSVKLTSAGSAFLAEVRTSFQAIERAIEVARQAARGELGFLTVGLISSVMDGNGPSLVDSFRKEQPGVVVQFHQIMAADIVPALRSRRIDVALTRTFDQQQDIEQSVIGREKLIVVLPTKHPLTTQKRIAPSDLRNESFVLFERARETRLYDAIYEVCTTSGFRPNVAMTSNVSIHALTAIVATGAGLSIVPESTNVVKRAGVTYRPLSPYSKELEVVVAHRRAETNILVRAFVELVSRKS